MYLFCEADFFVRANCHYKQKQKKMYNETTEAECDIKRACKLHIIAHMQLAKTKVYAHTFCNCCDGCIFYFNEFAMCCKMKIKIHAFVNQIQIDESKS